MATGTDTGGSIRIPASFCGCVGLKPTYERVSRAGVMPLGLTLDHMGPMARTVRDAAVSFQCDGGRRAAVMFHLAGVDIEGIANRTAGEFLFRSPRPGCRGRGSQRGADGGGAGCSDRRRTGARYRCDRTSWDGVLLLVEAVANLRPHLERRAEFGADVLALLDQGRLFSGDVLRGCAAAAEDFDRGIFEIMAAIRLYFYADVRRRPLRRSGRR